MKRAARNEDVLSGRFFERSDNKKYERAGDRS